MSQYNILTINRTCKLRLLFSICVYNKLATKLRLEGTLLLTKNKDILLNKTKNIIAAKHP